MKIENKNKIIADNGPLVLMSSLDSHLIKNKQEILTVNCFIDEVIINNTEFALEDDHLLLIVERTNLDELPKDYFLIDDGFSVTMNMKIDFGSEMGVREYNEIALVDLENDLLDNAYDDMSTWISLEKEKENSKFILAGIDIFVNIN